MATIRVRIAAGVQSVNAAPWTCGTRHSTWETRGRQGQAPLGSVGYEPEIAANGERIVWLETRWVNKLAKMSGPNETYSDVIVRLAAA
jgi:hypothetical protein